MGYAEINGTRIFYLIEGDGPPVFVIHGGLGFDHTLCPPMFEHVRARFQFVYFDLRDHGKSDWQANSRFTYEELADDIDALRQHIGFNKITLIGHSAGGWIAQIYAAKYAESLDRLILLNASCRNPDEYRERSMELIGAASVRSPEYAERARGVSTDFRNLTAEEAARSYAMTAHWYFYRYDGKMEEKVGPILRNLRINQEAYRCDLDQRHSLGHLRELLGSIGTRTLVVSGRHDPICPVEEGEEIHRMLPNSRMRILEQCGHFAGLEQPEDFEELLLSFMSS